MKSTLEKGNKTVPLVITLDKFLLDKFFIYCDERGLNRSKFLRNYIRSLVEVK